MSGPVVPGQLSVCCASAGALALVEALTLELEEALALELDEAAYPLSGPGVPVLPDAAELVNEEVVVLGDEDDEGGFDGGGGAAGFTGGFGGLAFDGGLGFEDDFPAQPRPPAIGDQAGSWPGTQSEMGGLTAFVRSRVYEPSGYVGHPLAA